MSFTTARGIRTLWSFTLNFLPGAALVELCSRSPSCSVGATFIERRYSPRRADFTNHANTTPLSAFSRSARQASAASPWGGDNEPGAACFMEAVMAN